MIQHLLFLFTSRTLIRLERTKSRLYSDIFLILSFFPTPPDFLLWRFPPRPPFRLHFFLCLRRQWLFFSGWQAPAPPYIPDPLFFITPVPKPQSVLMDSYATMKDLIFPWGSTAGYWASFENFIIFLHEMGVSDRLWQGLYPTSSSTLHFVPIAVYTDVKACCATVCVMCTSAVCVCSHRLYMNMCLFACACVGSCLQGLFLFFTLHPLRRHPLFILSQCSAPVPWRGTPSNHSLVYGVSTHHHS